MALTKVLLRGYGLNEEQVQAIIDGHMESVTGLQDEVEKYKSESESNEKKLAKVQKELDTIKEDAERNEGKNPYKIKYEAIKEEFDNYKADITAKETKASKEKAYRDLLKEVGIAEKWHDRIIKGVDFSGLEFDEEGKFKDLNAVKESVRNEWSDCISTKGIQGVQTTNPPSNVGGKRSREEILAIKDTAERQKAMLENKEMFLE